jgi:hypothetical protein
VQFSCYGTLSEAGDKKHGRDGGVSRGYFFQRRVTLLINGKEEKFNRGSLIDFLNEKKGQNLDKGWSGLRSIKWSPSGDKDKAIREAFETVFPLAKQSEGNEKPIKDLLFTEFQSLPNGLTERFDFYEKYLTELYTQGVAKDQDDVILDDIYNKLSESREILNTNTVSVQGGGGGSNT